MSSLPASSSLVELPPPATASVVHIDALPPGTRLHEFEIQGLVGVGGFGMVYRAYDHSLQRTVAIKEYLPVALVGRAANLAVTMRSSAEGDSFAAGLESFLAEARLLARFDHPSLVKVYRYWEANATAYMAMPLYQGMTLKQARAQMDHPPPEHWLRALLWSLLQALRVLHHGDTLHRDISPDNIFLQDDGPPVLLDLGSARRAMLERSQQQTAILKVHYAPIEQFAGAGSLRQGPWTDMYSLACVVHALLCNEVPVPATTRVVEDSLPPLDHVARTIQQHFGLTYSRAFLDAVGHALAVQPNQRPQSVEAWADEMDLTHPGDMSAFDWRAALREPLPVTDRSDEYSDTQFVGTRFAETVIAEIADATTVQPRPTRKTQAVNRRGAQHSSREHLDLDDAPASHPHPRPVWFNWAVGAALGLLLLTVLAYLWQQREATRDATLVSESMKAPRAATPSVSAPPQVAVAPASSEQVVVAGAASVSVTPPAALPAASVRAAVAPASSRPGAMRNARVPAPNETARTTAAASGAAAPDTASARALDSVNPGVAVASHPATPRTQAGRELCAQASFLARPMCLYEECQKRENTNLAVCVENRQQLRRGQRDSNNL